MRAVAVAAAFLISACTTLTPFERASIEAQRWEGRPDGLFRFAEASSQAARSQRWDILTFFADDAEIVVRRMTGNRTRQAGVSWASSRDCAGLTEIVAHLRDIEAPAFNNPLDSHLAENPDRSIVITADGAAINVWMDGLYRREEADYLGVDYAIGGNVDSPAGHWFARASEVLENCWREEMPPL
jgi:hypothetical protein